MLKLNFSSGLSVLSASPMRTFVNRLNRFGDSRFPIPFAWCLSLSYSQCRAAITGFVARLHSVIHPAGVQPLRRTLGARRRTHSPADGTFKRFRIGLRSLPWRRLLSLNRYSGALAGICCLCRLPHGEQFLSATLRQRRVWHLPSRLWNRNVVSQRKET